ncbi:MAG TPA: aspartyl protease family protein [Candidatus Limnocylindria bacterium]|nr:aspartyl protease family protein [Candidatus Limnocylindria bacterium]
MHATRFVLRLAVVGLLAAAWNAGASPAATAQPLSAWRAAETIEWPAETELVPFENLEGMILLRASLRGATGADTAGLFVLDTGAGYLALDLPLARALGVSDSDGTPALVDLANRPLPSFTLGKLSMTDVEPLLTIDSQVIRRATDKNVLGLLGQQPLSDRAVWIDYRAGLTAMIPVEAPGRSDDGDEPENPVQRSRGALAKVISARAAPVVFRIVGDGKALVQVRVSSPRPPRFSRWLSLIVDTGASKTVLFAETLDRRIHARWPTLRGLTAPTLIGAAEAYLARIPALDVRAEAANVRVDGIDVAVIESGLSQMLSRVAEEQIHGLLGYSFLKRFRVVLDYPNRVLWLDPIPDYVDDRPLEYSHVGIQLERREGRVVVAAVARGSPAARAGIGRDDELVAIDGKTAKDINLRSLAGMIEGEPGSAITLTVRRDAVARTHRLRRRQLL